jgi:hypothetical protein
MSGLINLMLEIGILLALAAGLFFALGWWARGLNGEPKLSPSDAPSTEAVPSPSPTPDLSDTVAKLEQQIEALHTQNTALNAELVTLREAAATPDPAGPPPKPIRPRKKKS